MYQVLFNPTSGNGAGKEAVKKIGNLLNNEEINFIDVTKFSGYEEFMRNLSENDTPILVGGDGTINYFVNNYDMSDYKGRVYYYPAGSGNDFMSDAKSTAIYLNENRDENGNGILDLTDYINYLPTVTINEKEYKFLNGIGFGIDGYCCEIGDELRKTSTKPVNYAGIAIKGMLGKYKPTNAKVTVDGKIIELKKVWLCPIMNGRFYGGGMIPTPAQYRKNPEHTLSAMAFTGSGRLKTLLIFPSIFKGEHVGHTDVVKIFSGHSITVEFDRPVSAQVDGETILNVSKISAEYK